MLNVIEIISLFSLKYPIPLVMRPFIYQNRPWMRNIHLVGARGLHLDSSRGCCRMCCIYLITAEEEATWSVNNWNNSPSSPLLSTFSVKLKPLMSVISSEACLPVSGPNSKLTCFCGAFEHVRFVLRPVCTQPGCLLLPGRIGSGFGPSCSSCCCTGPIRRQSGSCTRPVGCLTPVRWVL